MNLFNELKRRNVFRVGVAYLALAWLVIQVTDMAVPALNLDESLNGIVFYLGLIGFPFALFFSWAFELTPEGVKKTAEVDADESMTHNTGSKIDKMIIAFLSLAVIALASNQFIFYDDGHGAEESVDTEKLISIAVLPFADMSADGTQEYFGDGIAEELLNVLVRIDGLRVPSRTSSFAFKEETGMSAKDIGSQLQVDHVLEGSIRTSGNTVRITAQLIDVKTDTHLWSDTFDRDLTDIFAIQDEISAAIVDALKVELGKGAPIHENTTKNMAAYEAYLKGITAFGKRGGSFGGFIEQALVHFEEATRLDPTYADAWAAYARALAFSPNYQVPIPMNEAVERARSAIKLALLLDPNNVHALTTSGVILFQYDADFDAAAAVFERAIGLNPNNSEIYNFYGDQLFVLMDYKRAVEIEGKAYQLDPGSVINLVEYAEALFGVGRTDEAIALFEKGIIQYPQSPFPISRLIDNLLYTGRGDEALKYYDLPVMQGDLENRYNTGTPIEMFKAYHFGDREALKALKSIESPIYGIEADIYFEWGEYDMAAKILNDILEIDFNYFNFRNLRIFDPRFSVDHKGINEALSHPKYKVLMDRRRQNLGLPTK